MVLVAALLAVLVAGRLLGLAGRHVRALVAGIWLAALALALIAPAGLSLRWLGWDWRVMLIVTGLGGLAALYVGVIRHARRRSGIGRLRAEAEAARTEGAAVQARIRATRAQARAAALRAVVAEGEGCGWGAVLVLGPAAVTAPLCLALAEAGTVRVGLSGQGASAVADAVAALYPGCRLRPLDTVPPVAGCALVIAADGEAEAIGAACVAAGVPLLHGRLEGGAARLRLWHPGAGWSGVPGVGPAPSGAAAPDVDGRGTGALLGAVLAVRALALLADGLADGLAAVAGCGADPVGAAAPDRAGAVGGGFGLAAGNAEQKPAHGH